MPAIAEGVDPNAFADSEFGFDVNAAGLIQVTAGENLDSRAEAQGVTSWEPVESQPEPASSFEVAYWFESASFGDFFL
jgi:hypothetical protein